MSRGALVHEWLATTGGSENVLEAFAAMFPDAPITCLWDDEPARFTAGRVSETWLARTALRRSKAAALPFMPATWRHLPAADADWVLCSSHLFSHHARFAGPARSAPKYVYVHTPARYVWVPELDPRGAGIAARAVSAALKPVDRRRAQEAHSIAANSAFIRQRVEDAWQRDAIVIHPPVAVERFAADPAAELTASEQLVLAGLPSEFLLGASRLVSYKRLDLVIETGAASAVPVVIAGEGPELPTLRALAERVGANVRFLARPSDVLLRALYGRALAYVFPPVEDFGIMPVEAMAAGAPVIANAVGGAAESVVDGVTGALVRDFERAALQAAVDTASRVDRNACRVRARDFSVGAFEAKVRAWLPV